MAEARVIWRPQPKQRAFMERPEYEALYGGAAGDLIAAFLKETHISADEAARLRRMLDEMEV